MIKHEHPHEHPFIAAVVLMIASMVLGVVIGAIRTPEAKPSRLHERVSCLEQRAGVPGAVCEREP